MKRTMPDVRGILQANQGGEKSGNLQSMKLRLDKTNLRDVSPLYETNLSCGFL